MSWKQAQDEADKWLKTLPLPVDLRDQYIDLTAYASTLEAEARWRGMILQAAARLLKKRGARVSYRE